MATETKTPYGTIFRSGDREWFPGSVEEFRTAKAWEENQKNNKWCSTCDRPKAYCACVENGGTYCGDVENDDVENDNES